ncbi:hypothetical protein BS78_02G022200 [Paspalum vaginatum]|nr:hypothetical protein BS78_02G022200 [Paspalum vaginatum]
MASRATVMVLAAALAVLLLAAAAAPAASARRVESAAVSRREKLQGSEEAAGSRGCEGANDEDECMMRRTLAAHTDYIYTQQNHN